MRAGLLGGLAACALGRETELIPKEGDPLAPAGDLAPSAPPLLDEALSHAHNQRIAQLERNANAKRAERTAWLGTEEGAWHKHGASVRARATPPMSARRTQASRARVRV